MKKFLLSIAIILAAIIAIGGFAQHLFDWNQYRDELTAHASSAIGRQFEIKGDIKIAVLPSPVLLVKNVHLANVEGASDADMLILESIEIHVALAPLLGGNIQVTSIKLVNPVINIEFLEEGGDNFSLGQKRADQGSATNSQLPIDDAFSSVYQPTIGGFSVQIDNFVVENGTINYLDTPNKHIEQIQKLNCQFRLASLNGPMDTEGEAVFRDIPFSFSISVGQIVKGRTLPFNLATTIIPGSIKTDFTGSISNIKKNPQITGKFKVNGRSFGNLISATLGGMQPPELFARPFNAQAKVFLDRDILKFKELAIQLENLKGSGSAEVALGSNIDANVALSMNKLDLDWLLTQPSQISPKAPQSPEKRNSKKATNSAQFGSDALYPPAKKNSELFNLRSLPDKLRVNLNLSFEKVSFKNKAIRNAKLDASLANNEITLSQMSALFPGNSDIALFGFVTQTTNSPTFDGIIDLTTNDPRSLLKWLGVNIPEISKDRLQTLVFSSKIQANKNIFELSKIQMRVDSTKVRGSTKIVFRDRPTIGADLEIDKINLDAYLPKGATPKKNSTAEKAKKVFESSPVDQSGSKPIPLPSLSTVAGFDVKLKAEVSSLRYRGVPVSGFKVDSTLIGNNLAFNDLTVQNIAGIRGRITGNLSELNFASGLINPLFENFTIDVSGKSLKRLFKLLEIKLPLPLNKIGPVNLIASLNGKTNTLNIEAKLKALKGNFYLIGRAKLLDPIPSINGQINLLHPDLQALLRNFDVPYHPATGKLRSINLSGKLTGSEKVISFNQITGTAAGLRLEGDLEVKIDRSRPSIRVNIAAKNGINLNNFLPRKSATFIFNESNLEHAFKPKYPNPLLHQALWPGLPQRLNHIPWGNSIAIRDKRRWSTSLIDFTFLNVFDADITLKTPQFILNNFKFDKVNLAAKLKNGIFDLYQATGKLFGGDLNLDCKVTALPRKVQYQTKFTLKRLELKKALRAFGDRTLNSGTLEMNGDLHTSGSNIADMISRLNGSGSLSLSKVGISGGTGRGSILSGVTALLASLNQFAGSLGSKTGSGNADLYGSFKINKGVAKFNDLILNSNIGSGSAKGVVDLPNWYLNTKGNLKLSKNIFLQVLARQDGPQLIPFTVSGLLNEPKVNLDTSKFSGNGILIPGNIGKKIDKILKKKSIGTFLEKLLPAPRSAAPAGKTSSKKQPARQKSVQPKPRPEDLLKNLLKGLIR